MSISRKFLAKVIHHIQTEGITKGYKASTLVTNSSSIATHPFLKTFRSIDILTIAYPKVIRLKEGMLQVHPALFRDQNLTTSVDIRPDKDLLYQKIHPTLLGIFLDVFMYLKAQPNLRAPIRNIHSQFQNELDPFRITDLSSLGNIIPTDLKLMIQYSMKCQSMKSTYYLVLSKKANVNGIPRLSIPKVKPVSVSIPITAMSPKPVTNLNETNPETNAPVSVPNKTSPANNASVSVPNPVTVMTKTGPITEVSKPLLKPVPAPKETKPTTKPPVSIPKKTSPLIKESISIPNPVTVLKKVKPLVKPVEVPKKTTAVTKQIMHTSRVVTKQIVDSSGAVTKQIVDSSGAVTKQIVDSSMTVTKQIVDSSKTVTKQIVDSSKAVNKQIMDSSKNLKASKDKGKKSSIDGTPCTNSTRPPLKQSVKQKGNILNHTKSSTSNKLRSCTSLKSPCTEVLLMKPDHITRPPDMLLKDRGSIAWRIQNAWDAERVKHSIFRECYRIAVDVDGNSIQIAYKPVLVSRWITQWTDTMKLSSIVFVFELPKNDQRESTQMLQHLKPILENERIDKVFHAVPSDKFRLESLNISLNGQISDTQQIFKDYITLTHMFYCKSFLAKRPFLPPISISIWNAENCQRNTTVALNTMLHGSGSLLNYFKPPPPGIDPKIFPPNRVPGIEAIQKRAGDVDQLISAEVSMKAKIKELEKALLDLK